MRRRALAILGRGAKSFALGGVFVCAAVAGVVIHANLKATRRVVASLTNKALATPFLGRIVVGDIKELSVGTSGHAHIGYAEILDPEGRRVIFASGIDARIDLVRLVGSIVRGETPEVILEYANIDSAEVFVEYDAQGEIGIARAFVPRPSTAPKTAVPTAPTEDVRLSIANAYVRHAWVHGNVVPPKLDADGDDIRAKVFIFDNRLTVDVTEVTATVRTPRVPGQSSDIHGRAKGGLGVPLSATRADVTMHWDLVGDAAGMPLEAQLQLEKDRIVAQLDIAQVAPDVVRRAFPGLPLAQTVSVHAQAEGELTKPLAISANGQVGESTFKAVGELGLSETQPFRVDVDLARADGAAFGGPTSDVSGHVHAEGAIAGGAPAGTFRVTTDGASPAHAGARSTQGEGTVQGQRMPAIAAEGRFDGKRVDASFKASEPGVDVEGEVVLRIPEEKLTFDVRARSRDLRKVARAPGVVAGSATARATGTVDLALGTIAGQVTADGTGIARAPASAESVHVEATVSGPVANPLLDVTARAAQVRLTAADADKEPLTYPSATAHARVVLAPTPLITNGEVRIEGGGASIIAKASEVRIDKGGVDVRNGSVSGLGAPIEVDTHVGGGGGISLRVKGTDVDIGRVAAMTGIRELRSLPDGSRASLDVNVKTTPARTDGHLDVSVASKDGATTGELHARFDNRHISARGRVKAGPLGVIQMQHAELDLPGALSPETMKRATGVVDLYGVIDLSQGAALFGGESIERVSGTAIVSARIERGDPDNVPNVSATARTQDLDVTLNDEGKSTHIGGIDASIHVAYDGATDDMEVAALTWDANGKLANAGAKARVPLFAWVTGTKPFDRNAVAAIEIAGVVDVPRRQLGKLPGKFARPDLRGFVAAHADLTGSIGHPNVVVVAHADKVAEKRRAPGQQGQRYAPMDGVLEARWDGDHVVAALRVDEAERDGASPAAGARSTPDESAMRGAATRARPREDRNSGHLRGMVLARLPVADLLAGRPPAWNASVEMAVGDLELTPLPLPLNTQGVLTGRLSVRDLSGNPSLEMQAHVDQLSFARARVGEADVKVDAKNGTLAATASVQQADGGSGRVKIASSALAWHGTDVDWDASKATRIDYALDRLRLAFLRPVVRQMIPEINGRVDGSGSATVDATSHVFEGGLALTEGRFYVNALGEEISGATAVVRFERDGSFRVQEASAKIGTGTLKASVNGRMKGLRFESAEAVIVIPSKDGVPLASEGATFAQATGEVKLEAKMSPDREKLLVTVAVPRAKITLPDRSTQNLQSMEPDPTIVIGIRQPDGTLAMQQEAPGGRKRVAVPGQAMANAAEATAPEKPVSMRFTVSLGNEVTLEGRGLRLTLGGRTIVDIAQEIAVTGQISLRNGGTIDVQGRRFVVDRGTVTFVEGDDAADPIVVAAAYWDAPDRTRIWVEFNGPLKTGNLTLRSEPPYSKNEILSILLFGRADPNQARAGDAKAGGGDQAAAVGTGAVAAGFNKALGELDQDFELEQDRTSANRVRTKLGYRLRRTIKVQLAYATGFSQREPDTTYLFVEWQFIPKWALIGTRGDKGTSILDVVFQHRY